MGFFKKIFKGVKKVFKKIGKGIKKVAMKVGKFMDKIGIVGQIALMFIPLGPLLGGLLKGVGGIAARALTAMGPIGAQILKGAQFVIGKAGKFVTTAKNAFGTVTEGVSKFVSEFTKTGLNKIGFDATKFGFKAGGGLDTWVKSGSNSFGEAWGKVSTNITENAGKILDPFKSSITATSNTTLESISDSAFHSVDDIQKMNPQIKDWTNINGQSINLDIDNISTVIEGPSLINKSTIAQASVPQPSLLSPDTNLLTGQPIVSSVPDSFKGTPYKMPVVDTVGTDVDAGFFDSAAGNAVQGVGTSIATSLATDAARNVLAGDPPEAPDYGYVVNAGLVAVQGAGAAIDYGIGGSFTPQPSSPATGLYDGRNTYAANFQAFYGAAG
jgi:hypothetical protein